MIDKFGLEKMKPFFRIGNRNDTKYVIKEKFITIYSFSIEKAEADWLEFINKY